MNIPQVEEGDILDMTVYVDISTVVETWYVKLSNVTDVENISPIKSLVAMFRTYGKNPLYDNMLDLDLEIVDTGGKEEYFTFDVTDQFDGNKEHWIIIDDPIIIDKPAGGGFLPMVDEWKDIETDIII